MAIFVSPFSFSFLKSLHENEATEDAFEWVQICYESICNISQAWAKLNTLHKYNWSARVKQLFSSHKWERMNNGFWRQKAPSETELLYIIFPEKINAWLGGEPVRWGMLLEDLQHLLGHGTFYHNYIFKSVFVLRAELNSSKPQRVHLQGSTQKMQAQLNHLLSTFVCFDGNLVLADCA